MRLTPEQRRLIGPMVDNLGNKSLVAKGFGVTRATIDKWCERRRNTRDRKRCKRKAKITWEVEAFILALRNTLGWGSERIQKGLICLPSFMLNSLKELGVKPVQKTLLSRTSINNVLKKHGINGYKKKKEGWKFFRAKKPNELWQLDPKGPVRIQGKKYWFVICIDDYSRYLLSVKRFDHSPSADEIARALLPLIRKHKPKNILTDNNPFRKDWDEWCRKQKVTPLHAHRYYPQDKGKVERAIRNVAEEFIYLIKKFPQWLDHKLKSYKHWYNHKRFHQGIQTTPAQLYT